MGKLKDWIFATDEEEYEENFSEEVDADPKTSSILKNLIQLEQVKLLKSLEQIKIVKLVLFEPRAYGETQEIATF